MKFWIVLDMYGGPHYFSNATLAFSFCKSYLKKATVEDPLGKPLTEDEYEKAMDELIHSYSESRNEFGAQYIIDVFTAEMDKPFES